MFTYMPVVVVVVVPQLLEPELLMRVLGQRHQKYGCHCEAPLVSHARYWLLGLV